MSVNSHYRHFIRLIPSYARTDKSEASVLLTKIICQGYKIKGFIVISVESVVLS